MALSTVRTWLIAYDIRDPRRLQRVHRYLKSEAVPVQYSVFVTRVNANDLARIRVGLRDLIDATADDVRIYHVPDNPEITTLGRQGLPDGIQMLSGIGTTSALPFTRRDPAASVEVESEEPEET